MKYVLASLAALGAIGLAAPAHAQSYDRPYAERPYGGRAGDTGFQLERLRMRLRDGVESGAIAPRQARRLFAELRDIDYLRSDYLRTRGISDWEARDLGERIDALRMHMRREFQMARGGPGAGSRGGYREEQFEERSPRRAPDLQEDDRDWRAEEDEQQRAAPPPATSPRTERRSAPRQQQPDDEGDGQEYGPRYQQYERGSR